MDARRRDTSPSAVTPTAAQGQASVEALAVGMVVALLLVAAALWLSRSVALPERPPDLVGAVARPLGPPRAASAAAASAGPLPASRGAPAGSASPGWWRLPTRPAPRIVRGLTGVADRVAAPVRAAGRIAPAAGGALRLGVELPGAFVGGFRRRVRERAAEIATDPLSLLRALRDAGMGPEDAVRRMVDPADARRYLASLRALPAREAALRLAEDAGVQAADQAIAALTRRGLRAVRRGRGAGVPGPDGAGARPPAGGGLAPATGPAYLR